MAAKFLVEDGGELGHEGYGVGLAGGEAAGLGGNLPVEGFLLPFLQADFPEKGVRDVAVAVWVFVKVGLVVLLCVIEVLQRQDLDGEGLRVAGRLLVECRTYGRKVGRVAVVDAGAVAGAFIAALAVEAHRVYRGEIQLQQL